MSILFAIIRRLMTIDPSQVQEGQMKKSITILKMNIVLHNLLTSFVGAKKERKNTQNGIDKINKNTEFSQHYNKLNKGNSSIPLFKLINP